MTDLPEAARLFVNLTMFGRYWASRRGILMDRDADGFDIEPVDRWDDASEAERRDPRHLGRP